MNCERSYLEVYLQTELHQAGRPGAGYLAEGPVAECCIGWTELRRVECIEHLAAELSAVSLFPAEVFHDGHVGMLEHVLPGVREKPRSVADGVRCRRGKRGGCE